MFVIIYIQLHWFAMSCLLFCYLVLPVVINEMGAKHHNFQFKLVWVGFEPKHDRGQLGVVCSVACRHTHPQSSLLTLHQMDVEQHK